MGGIVAGFLAPHMNQAKDRQLARSMATEKIADLEGALWADSTYADFRKSVGSFRAAAIGAKIPKAWVDEYVALCKTLYGLRRHERPQDMPESEHRNLLDVLDNRASEYADAMVTVMWHPHRPRSYLAFLRRSTAQTTARAHGILADAGGYTDPLMGKTLRAWERHFAIAESGKPPDA